LGNRVQGNDIGTATDGREPLGNGADGIAIFNFAGHNLVGGGRALGNRIAFNQGRGVDVRSGSGNAVLSNSIFGNRELEIDLGGDGTTANDTCDADSGPNHLQNAPELTRNSALGAPLDLGIELQGPDGRPYRIQVFATDACHSGRQRLVRTQPLWTGPGCIGRVNVSFPLDTFAPGELVTATATDLESNTSELSSCIVAR
jgi:hypothetical protein